MPGGRIVRGTSEATPKRYAKRDGFGGCSFSNIYTKAETYSQTEADGRFGTVTDVAANAAAVTTIYSRIGVANYFAGLDATGKVPTSQLPAAVLGALSFQNSWDASANSPAIPAASPANKGYYYVVSTSGTTIIDGENDWQLGDWLVSNGTVWNKIDNTDLVTSVAGRRGAVVLSTSDVSGLGTLAPQNASNVNITGGTASLTSLTATSLLGGGDGIAIVGSVYAGAALVDILDSKVGSSLIGAANGVAPLNVSGKVPTNYLPDALLGAVVYESTWDASTNSPILPAASSSIKGHYYLVAVAGSLEVNVGEGAVDWEPGDWVVCDGTKWEKVDNSDAVTSVAGRTGVIVLTTADIGGLGSLALQNANSVAITGGTATLSSLETNTITMPGGGIIDTDGGTVTSGTVSSAYFKGTTGTATLTTDATTGVVAEVVVPDNFQFAGSYFAFRVRRGSTTYFSVDSGGNTFFVAAITTHTSNAIGTGSGALNAGQSVGGTNPGTVLHSCSKFNNSWNITGTSTGTTSIADIQINRTETSVAAVNGTNDYLWCGTGGVRKAGITGSGQGQFTSLDISGDVNIADAALIILGTVDNFWVGGDGSAGFSSLNVTGVSLLDGDVTAYGNLAVEQTLFGTDASFTGTITGSLDATNITSGTLSADRLPPLYWTGDPGFFKKLTAPPWAGPSGTVLLSVASFATLTPFYLPVPAKISQLAFNVTTAAASGKHLVAAVYDTVAGKPCNKIAQDATVLVDTTGNKNINFDTNVQVTNPAGWYWVAVLQEATVTLTSSTSGPESFLSPTMASASNNSSFRAATSGVSYAAGLPSVISGLTGLGNSGNSPFLIISILTS